MKAGDTIINTTSVTAHRSSPALIDYSYIKGAITTFTRSLATNLTEKASGKCRSTTAGLDATYRIKFR
nr:hypothetical protein [Mucilaginibacter pedocola]